VHSMVLLEEETRPGELMPAFEDEHGTYIMNSKDLRAVQHVHTLAALGIDSLKIKGRTKAFYYTARTTQVYRRAIEDAVGDVLDLDDGWLIIDVKNRFGTGKNRGNTRISEIQKLIFSADFIVYLPFGYKKAPALSASMRGRMLQFYE
jgi:collagenase-like PrtC family protease